MDKCQPINMQAIACVIYIMVAVVFVIGMRAIYIMMMSNYKERKNKMRMQIVVEPCKACGNRTGMIMYDEAYRYVRCISCGRETNRHLTEAEAFTEWNIGGTKESPRRHDGQ